MLRLGERVAAKALCESFVRPFDITGRPMKARVMVKEHGIEKGRDLRRWLDQTNLYSPCRPIRETLLPKGVRTHSGSEES